MSSLRDRLIKAKAGQASVGATLVETYGLKENPFPPSSQTSDNPHFPTDANKQIEDRIESFFRDQRSQVILVEGTQGVGKTSLLRHYEKELKEIVDDFDGKYVVRYLADPEASFDGTLRRLMQEFDAQKILELCLRLDDVSLEDVRNNELRVGLTTIHQYIQDHEYAELTEADDDDELRSLSESFSEWLQGLRILNRHRELGIQFRLDTLESRTLAFRDLVFLSSKAELLSGFFLLIDELEKQDGILSPTQVVRYLSAMRAIIDALPKHLFMLIAVTPDALRRYSVALPALRSRLQDKVELYPLTNQQQALDLARFYILEARKAAGTLNDSTNYRELLSTQEIGEKFEELYEQAKMQGDRGVRQRFFLHQLHLLAEMRIQDTARQVEATPAKKGVRKKIS